jgi:transposase
MTDSKKVTRRRHSSELKALVLEECARPGASVASVAMAHGINANVVHKWRRLAAGGPSSPATPEFVALPLPQPIAAGAASSIRIELRRGAMSVAVDWPLAASSECATWLRELLR